MTLTEYANIYPITDEERQREANNAEILAQQAAANKKREQEQQERLQRAEQRKAQEAAAKATKEANRLEAHKLTQEVYEGACMGCNASELLLKAIKALSLINNRPQDYTRLNGAIKNVYAIGLEIDQRKAEIKDINRRLELLQHKIRELEALPTPTTRETVKDLKRAIDLNKKRLKQLEEQKEQPAQQSLTVEPTIENPFL
jgi:hypothetical protein